MDNRKKVLIISKNQFGYHTDAYKYCQHLRFNVDFTFVCFDLGLAKKELDKVDVLYVPVKGSYINRALNFYRTIFWVLRRNVFDTVFVVNFDFCFILQLFRLGPKYILDIRTASVNSSWKKRFLQDLKLQLNIKLFRHISLISRELATILNIKKYYLLPLGADTIASIPKKFVDLRLLYVGILTNRDIHKTISGLHLFLRNQTNGVNVSYDIVGFGAERDIIAVSDAIERYGLDSIVKFHGRKSLEELKPYFEMCNVGVSYVPITPYYDKQPATKTFEYLLSGMACIATNTTMNREVINESNGVLCDDSPESFAVALQDVCSSFINYDSDHIKLMGIKYSWGNICNEYFLPLLV